MRIIRISLLTFYRITNQNFLYPLGHNVLQLSGEGEMGLVVYDLIRSMIPYGMGIQETLANARKQDLDVYLNLPIGAEDSTTPPSWNKWGTFRPVFKKMIKGPMYPYVVEKLEL